MARTSRTTGWVWLGWLNTIVQPPHVKPANTQTKPMILKGVVFFGNYKLWLSNFFCQKCISHNSEILPFGNIRQEFVHYPAFLRLLLILLLIITTMSTTTWLLLSITATITTSITIQVTTTGNTTTIPVLWPQYYGDIHFSLLFIFFFKDSVGKYENVISENWNQCSVIQFTNEGDQTTMENHPWSRKPSNLTSLSGPLSVCLYYGNILCKY